MNFGESNYNTGASQFAGGGFVPSPAPGGEGGFGGNAQRRNGGAGKDQTLRAVTLRQLHRDNADVDDDHFSVDGQDISTITFVGRIVSCQEQATRAVLVVHDGTGSIEVTHWLNDTDPDSMAAKKVEWRAGSYVRVYGNMKVFDKRKSVNAYCLKPILDHNEVTHHFLQAIFQHLHLTKGAPAGPGAMQQPSKVSGGAYGGAPSGAYGAAPVTNAGYSAPAPMPASGASAGINDQLYADLSNIYNGPDAANRSNGLNVDEALSALRSMGRNYTSQQVIFTLDFMANEGHLYTTLDERTYKSTSV